MLNKPSTFAKLLEERSRYAYSMQISLAIALFFALAWCLLQWSLAEGEQFAGNSTATRFAALEAAFCIVAAVCAGLGLVANAIAWAGTVLKMRRAAASRPAAGRMGASRRIPAIG